MDVLERNYKFYFNIYESCSPKRNIGCHVCLHSVFLRHSKKIQKWYNSFLFRFLPVRNVQYHLSENYYRKFHSNGKRSWQRISFPIFRNALNAGLPSFLFTRWRRQDTERGYCKQLLKTRFYFNFFTRYSGTDTHG